MIVHLFLKDSETSEVTEYRFIQVTKLQSLCGGRHLQLTMRGEWDADNEEYKTLEPMQLEDGRDSYDITTEYDSKFYKVLLGFAKYFTCIMPDESHAYITFFNHNFIDYYTEEEDE